MIQQNGALRIDSGLGGGLEHRTDSDDVGTSFDRSLEFLRIMGGAAEKQSTAGDATSFAEAQIILASLLARFGIGLAGQRPVIPVASITLGPDHEPDFTLTPISQARP